MGKKKGILLASLVLFGLMLIASGSQAQLGKLGYVDSDKIFANYDGWVKAQEEFETEYKAWDNEAREMQQELTDLIDEFEKQKTILSPEKRREKEAAIDTKRNLLDSFTKQIFGPQGEAERRNATMVRPLLENINAAIEQVATDENYDFVFNSDGLAYARKDFDITDKVLEALLEE